MENKRYKISNETIKDIINNIPKENWEDVISDLHSMLHQMKGTIDLVKTTADSMGIDSTDIIEMPDSIIWVDDGKGENQINISGDDKKLYSLKFKNN